MKQGLIASAVMLSVILRSLMYSWNALQGNGQYWINENFIEKQLGCKHPPIGVGMGPFTLTQAYKNKAMTIVQKRAALAGARLGEILNNELK